MLAVNSENHVPLYGNARSSRGSDVAYTAPQIQLICFFDVSGRNICTSLSNFPEKQFSAVSCSLAIRLDWRASFSVHVVVTFKNISSSSSSLDRQLQELFFILHSSREPLDGTVSIQFFFLKN